MTKTNEKNLLELLGEAHIGDTDFEKKHGLKITPVLPEGKEPSEKELLTYNKLYVEKFVSQVADKLNHGEVSDSFLYDLIFSAPSVPLAPGK